VTLFTYVSILYYFSSFSSILSLSLKDSFFFFSARVLLWVFFSYGSFGIPTGETPPLLLLLNRRHIPTGETPPSPRTAQLAPPALLWSSLVSEEAIGGFGANTHTHTHREIPSLQEKFQLKKKAKRNGNLAPNLDNKKKEKKLQTVVGQRNTSFTPQIPERASEEEKILLLLSIFS
jgi:hypothetical protein